MGASALVACLALLVAAPAPVGYLREQVFDLWQRLAPRERQSAPAVIVEIDEKSLEARGQWPWPRPLTAELLRAIAAAKPAAIGIDMLFTEPDRSAPDADAQLAAALKSTPTVLGVAGLDNRDRRFPFPPQAAPFRVPAGEALALRRYDGHLQSRADIHRAASGRGLISADSSGGVIRRAQILARVGSTVVPALSVETIRVAASVPLYRVQASGRDRLALRVGDLEVPLQSDGTMWIRYGRHDPHRFLSAEAVLSGKADPAALEGKLVLVGVSGLGLVDQQVTPLGERIPGVEIHAQLLEQMFDGQFLLRPGGAAAIEAAVLALLGILMIVLVPRLSPWRAAAVGAATVCVPVAGAFALFIAGTLVDGATPAVGAAIIFAATLAASFAEADRQRRQLREAQARVAGELDAARRIQMGLLPVPTKLFTNEPSIAMDALLEPARSVGGDFYDCFKLDAHRVFFTVADVSGKGMPAALFMALSKAILKANALRGTSEIGVAVTRANAEIARENPESLFVTAFTGILDLRTGMLEYANAGHEPPSGRKPGQTIARFDIAEGPPLCALDDFDYPTSYRQLTAGEWLCVVTDGITEAMNARGELYGGERLAAVLSGISVEADPSAVCAAVRDDVRRFVGKAEPSDDLTLLCLRWNGPAALGLGPAAIDDVIDEAD